MSAHFEPVKPGEDRDHPADPARRTLLRYGAKLAYVVPVVLAALKATPASAQPAPSGPPRVGVLTRQPHEVPAGMLVLIAGIERPFALACSS